ncbi:MAG: hypothetical protein HOF98_09030, partial [Gammaproteobacteria bacterium]|nr:hypothetical protein [Gammaproteobacteria bacterium]
PEPEPEPEPGVFSVVEQPTARVFGNGTWIYDAQFPDGPTGGAFTSAGLWAEKLINHNQSAAEGHKINQLFTYGGSLEMYCKGSGESDFSEACNSKNMLVTYFPPSFYNTNLTFDTLGDSGYESTVAYKIATDFSKPETNTVTKIIPIIDGRVDNPVSNDYLNAFNIMSQSEANLFADNVARVYCADPHVSGVQFDIEPFDITQLGQKYFYERIAMNLAGENSNHDFDCKNVYYPQGRSFSVFTFPSVINKAPETLASILNEYNNGYVVYSLYDLGSLAAGSVSSPAVYQSYVQYHLNAIKILAQQYGVYFQLAIPAAASVHEYEATATYQNGDVVNVQQTGYGQVEYVKTAIETINSNNMRQLPQFMGIDLWGWSKYMSYPPHTNNIYLPNQPTGLVLEYLEKNL